SSGTFSSMKTLPLIVVLLVFVAAGENNQKHSLEVPPERLADTYAVYDAALHNPLVGDHQGEPKAYFISDRTGDTYGQEDPEKCIDGTGVVSQSREISKHIEACGVPAQDFKR